MGAADAWLVAAQASGGKALTVMADAQAVAADG